MAAANAGQQLEQNAYHEAGHAVVGNALGFILCALTANDQPLPTAGGSCHWKSDSVDPIHEPIEKAAGLIAQEIHTNTPARFTGSADADFLAIYTDGRRAAAIDQWTCSHDR